MPSVDVATIGKTASGIVFVFCLMTLAFWGISGFYLIYPPLGVLIMAICALLFAVSVWAERRWHATNRR